MPGKHINQNQEELYMTCRNQNQTQRQAASRAGISSRSGRRIEKGNRLKKSHVWRTRTDPLCGVWAQVLLPMLKAEPELMPMTLFEYLHEHYPDKYPAVLRTLQRRVSDWKARHGPDKEIIFRQSPQAGMTGMSDFSHPDMAITIDGKPFKHLLYQFCLPFSHWRHVTVVQGGESFAALSTGLQNALHKLGGTPRTHRTDSLSAARNNRENRWSNDYQALCDHYGLEATVNNKGKSHENGSIEAQHGVLKKRLRQALLLRASHDFESIDAYQQFVQEIADKLNRRYATRLQEERATLKALPSNRFTDYNSLTVKVTRSSTIYVKRVLYSVPSRLIGHSVHVHLYHDRLEGFVGQGMVFACPRVYVKKGELRARRINCSHIIRSLICKPQAFRTLSYRNDLLYSKSLQTLWKIADSHFDSREACRWMVRILFIRCFHDENIEQQMLQQWHIKQTLPSRFQLDKRGLKSDTTPEQPTIVQHDLQSYNLLLHCSSKLQEGTNVSIT